MELTKKYVLRGTIALSIIIFMIFSASLIVSFFSYQKNSANAIISVKDIHSAFLKLEACDKSNEETNNCENIRSSTIDDLNGKLGTIESALKIEEMTALIGIFVTLSTFALPLFLFFNMRNDREKMEARLQEWGDKSLLASKHTENLVNTAMNSFSVATKDILDTANDMIKTEIQRVEREIEDNVTEYMMNQTNNRSRTRNKIMLHAYKAKSNYIVEKTNLDMNLETITDIQKMAYEIENNILNLMSENDNDVENSVKKLKSLIDPSDYKMHYISEVRNSIKHMSEADFVESLRRKRIYGQFLTFLGEDGDLTK